MTPATPPPASQPPAPPTTPPPAARPPDPHGAAGPAPAGRPRAVHPAGPPDRVEGDHAGQPGSGPGSLADRQAALVGSLTAGRPVPPGFDAFRLEAARTALLRKRAGEVARQWPMMAAGFGDRWKREFASWAAERPTQGSLRDGWDLARDLSARQALPSIAAPELAGREAAWHYDGSSTPRPRRFIAFGSVAGVVALQVAGRVWLLRRP